ncbi:MAG TPA: permease [Bauldia sp.]|nr:permease [Bauldia sp.]
MARAKEPSLGWLARNELRLSWRDWQAMITAGNKRSLGTALTVLLVVGLVLHLPAYAMLGPVGKAGIHEDVASLISVSLIVVLYTSLLLAQAMETVTRTLYSRGDLDLVMSSPVSPRRLFAVRIFINALLVAMMAVLLSSPLIDVLILTGGWHWLSAYVVSIAVGLTAGGLAVAITIGLFRLLGPRRTRLVAQVVAAIIGAAFAIGIQVMAILYYGQLNRRVFAVSSETAAAAPPAGSLLWLPARAVLGDPLSLLVVALAGLVILGAVILVFAPRLGEHSLAATDLPSLRGRARSHRFDPGSPATAMRRKEWRLLRRDPWLVSQTLTQLLYLIPAALLLMRNFGQATGVLIVIVMVLVTVGGQLGGALAWLAISGEDAPELVATAPVSPRAVTRAKIEAVLGAIAAVLGPLVVALAFLSPLDALMTAIGLLFAALSTIRIQLWFRSQAKRSNFRRRHTSSRIATFGEALVSFSWASAAGLAAAGTWFAAISVASALLILAAVRAVSPRKAAAV